jgi:hypothetical protein
VSNIVLELQLSPGRVARKTSVKLCSTVLPQQSSVLCQVEVLRSLGKGGKGQKIWSRVGLSNLSEGSLVEADRIGKAADSWKGRLEQNDKNWKGGVWMLWC